MAMQRDAAGHPIIPQQVIDEAFKSAAQFMILVMKGYNTELTSAEREHLAGEFINILQDTYNYDLSPRGREIMVTQISARLLSLGY